MLELGMLPAYSAAAGGVPDFSEVSFQPAGPSVKL